MNMFAPAMISTIPAKTIQPVPRPRRRVSVSATTNLPLLSQESSESVTRARTKVEPFVDGDADGRWVGGARRTSKQQLDELRVAMSGVLASSGPARAARPGRAIGGGRRDPPGSVTRLGHRAPPWRRS